MVFSLAFIAHPVIIRHSSAHREFSTNLSPIKRNLFVAGVKQNKFTCSLSASVSNKVPESARLLNTTPLRSESYASRQPTNPTIRFLRSLFVEWRLLVPAIIAALLGSLSAVCIPVLYGRTVGFLARAASLDPVVGRVQLLGHVARLFTAFAIESVMTFIFVSLAARAIDRSTRRLRERLFEKSLRNDVGFFDETGRSTIEHSITREVKSVRDTMMMNLSKDRGLRAIVEVICGIIVSVSITGTVGFPVFGLLVPILATTSARIGMRNGRLAFNVERKEGDVQSYVNERIQGLRTIKAFGAEKRESRALGSLLDNVEQVTKKSTLSRGTTEAISRFTIYTTMLSYLTVGGLLICAQRLSYEMFACLTGYVWNLNFCMAGLSFTLTDSAKLSKSLESIYSLIDGAKSYSSYAKLKANGTTIPSTYRGEVQFNKVYFSYPSRSDVMVLSDINLSLRPGQMVALVGSSGGGKSTIAALLSRMYAATSGRVTLDGTDIQSIPPEVYARQISVVEQDPVLFQGTIRDNIAYGRPDDVLDDEVIIQAAKEANAHDFIMKLPDGYNTLWTPASNISGGQRQRIAIARSLVKSPRILILDEATSALDQESERLVQNALERIMQNRTVLLIAHRLSTVQSANLILFVRDGEVVEQGEYKELLSKQDGHFRALVNSASNYVDCTAPPF